VKAIVPVAGVGSRLKPHTLTRAKVLINVAGKPMISHIVDRLIEQGVDHMVFVVGHFHDQVEEYLRAHYPTLSMEFVIQVERKGLAHAVYLCLGDDPAPVLIILGDTIFDVDLKPVLSQGITSLGSATVDDPRRFGTIEMEKGKVVRLVEKPKEPKSNLVIVGIYYIANTPLLKQCIEGIMAENITVKNEYQITDALQRMIDHGEQINTFHVEGWYDCGKPETLLATNKYFLSLNDYPIPETVNSVILPPSYIPKSAVVENSVVGPYTTLGEDTIIKNSIVRNAIIGDRTRVESVMLDSSIIGVRAVVEGQFKILNISDSSEIRIE
jgi:glucose-1-phosphate thymidylyltransferase